MRLTDLKLFIRKLKRDPIVSSINAFGLSIGLLSALLIFKYVHYERSFDSHHADADNIYRVAYKRFHQEELMWDVAHSYFPIGTWLVDNYTEVEDFTQLVTFNHLTISLGIEKGDPVSFNEAKTYYATNSFFEVFSTSIIEGPSDCLSDPNQVAISKRAASKYFGNESPIGEVLLVNGREQYVVSAVYETMPFNSIIKSDFLFSFESFYQKRPALRTQWSGDIAITFLKLNPGTDPNAFAAKAFPVMIERNHGKLLKDREMSESYYLQPLRDIHLYSNIEAETEPPGNGKIVSILSGFSLFILLVAWINYINLTTAKAMDRAREIGVKKIVGASRKSLVLQFFSEALFFNLICLGVAVVLFELIDPFFSKFTGIYDYSYLSDKALLFKALGIFVLGVFISSLYPAFILQSFKPITVLRGKFRNSTHGIFLRKVLIAIQFMISVVLLIGTIVSFLQSQHLMTKGMGIDYDRTVVVRLPKTAARGAETRGKLDVISNDLSKISEIEGHTFTSDIPGLEIETYFGCYRKGYDRNDAKSYFQIATDPGFHEFFDAKLLAGRFFRANETIENRKLLLSLKGVQRLGYETPEDALNKIVIGWGDEFEVIGVVDDFHYHSIKIQPVPMVITLNNRHQYLTIRLSPFAYESPARVLSEVERIFEKHFPESPYDHFFLQEWMQEDLKSETTFAIVFSIFSALAILVSIIGVVGLTLITMKQRMKEIAIRKAMGSTLMDVSMLILKQLANQVLIASIIVIPVAWYGYQKFFINNYLYQIELKLWMFALPILFLIVVLISVVQIIAVGGFKIKIAPVLQYE